jgi:hypothetical protein
MSVIAGPGLDTHRPDYGAGGMRDAGLCHLAIRMRELKPQF